MQHFTRFFNSIILTKITLQVHATANINEQEHSTNLIPRFVLQPYQKLSIILLFTVFGRNCFRTVYI